MNIDLKAKHIVEAMSQKQPWFDETCNPIAYAMRDAGLEHAIANWRGGVLSWAHNDNAYVCSMPFEVKKWLIMFVNYEKVEPFEFQIYFEQERRAA